MLKRLPLDRPEVQFLLQELKAAGPAFLRVMNGAVRMSQERLRVVPAGIDADTDARRDVELVAGDIERFGDCGEDLSHADDGIGCLLYFLFPTA
jgi:hypothetical protein